MPVADRSSVSGTVTHFARKQIERRQTKQFIATKSALQPLEGKGMTLKGIEVKEFDELAKLSSYIENNIATCWRTTNAGSYIITGVGLPLYVSCFRFSHFP